MVEEGILDKIVTFFRFDRNYSFGISGDLFPVLK